MSINVTCHFRGSIINVVTKLGNQPAKSVVTAAFHKHFGVDGANQKLSGVVAIMVDHKIYGINQKVSLNNGDAIILLIEPVPTATPPGDESITPRVYERHLTEEGIEEATMQVEAVRLLRHPTVPILLNDLNNVPSDAATDDDDSSSRKSSSESDGSSGDNPDANRPTGKLVAFLSNYGFMPCDNTNLGKAGDTFVYRGYLLANGAPAVLKGFDKFDDLCRETRVYEHLAQQEYRHMPRMLKTHCKDDEYVLITEDLGDEPLTLESKQDVKLFAVDLLTAVNALHKRRLIHSDLKPSNLRYFKDKRLVKLFDFSYSSIVKYTHLSAQCFGFTHGYASPEVLDTDKVTTADDMFSVGMILASIVYKFKPRHDDDYKQVVSRIEAKELTPLCNGSMLDLISQLLTTANVRLSAEQALRAPVFNEAVESLSSGDDEMCLD